MNVLLFAYRSWARAACAGIDIRQGHNLHVFSLPEYATVETFEARQPDFALFYGWSWIVPAEIVNRWPCLALHPSPLPKYRGGSPLQHQIIAGEEETEVCVFRMTEDLDAGPVCYRAPLSLRGNMEEIFEALARTAKDSARHILTHWGSLAFVPQQGAPTIYKRRRPEESEITLDELRSSSVKSLHDKVRALGGPYPNAYVRTRTGKLYLHRTSFEE